MRARHILALAAAGLAVTATLTACGSGNDDDSSPQGGSPTSSTATGSASDIAFAQLMIAHHEQAIEMAELAAQRAGSAEVKALAGGVHDAQAPEIQQMEAWLDAWHAPREMPGASDGSMDHSGMDMGGMSAAGMMSAEDMAALMDASGRDFDRMYLQMMIAHHQGAITMANEVLAETTDADVEQLAQSIVDAQTAEIDQMRQLLAG